MTRFGDFTLLEELGRSAVGDRYKAMHATQGGPFFLKVYSRLEPTQHGELLRRCESLIGKSHANLVRHLGHGVVDGLPFVVAPFHEGIDLAEMSTSLRDRRVTIGLESVLLLLADLAAAVGALHGFAPVPNGASGPGTLLGHGDVSLGHVRLGADGQVWLTGLTTPRGDVPGKVPEGRWDLAGVGALVYDLVPLLRGGAARPPLPGPLDRVVRRALGIGLTEDRIGPPELVERIGEVSAALKLKPDRTAFAELVRRTVRAVEKRIAEAGGARTITPARGAARSPADAIPSLDPVDRIPTLEPLLAKPAPQRPQPPQGRGPAPILELIPVGGPIVETEATTKLVGRTPPRTALPPADLEPLLDEPPAIIGRVENVGPLLRPLEPDAPPERAAFGQPPALLPQPATDLRSIAPIAPATPSSSFLTGSAARLPTHTPSRGSPSSLSARSMTPPPALVPSQPSLSPSSSMSPPSSSQSSPQPSPSPSPSMSPPSMSPPSMPPPSMSPPSMSPPSSSPSSSAQPPFDEPLEPWASSPPGSSQQASSLSALPTGAPPMNVAHAQHAAMSPMGAAHDDDPFASPPHTDPLARAKILPRIETPAARPGMAPFGELPPDVDEAVAPKPAPPPLPKKAAATSKPPHKRPLLADPDEPGTVPAPTGPPTAPPSSALGVTSPGMAAVPHPPQRATAAPPMLTSVANAALDERTRDQTDPEQRSTRAAQARQDPAVRALLARGVVSEEALKAAIDEHTIRGGRVVEILVANGSVSDAQVADALAAESGRLRLPDEALKTRLPPPALVRRLPQTYVLARRVLPLSLENGVLTLVVADPYDHPTHEELRNLLNARSVEPLVCARAAVTAAAVEAYRNLGIGGVPGTAAGGVTVLLCTPDESKAARIGARLAQEGMRVEHVVDGGVAKEIVQNRAPDVIICAHDLPGVGSAALLLFAREQPQTAEMPFFVFGPRGDEQLATKLLDLGADDFFSEPLKIEVLLSKVRRAARKGRSMEGGALNDPSLPRISLPPASVDEQTPVHAIPLPTAAQIKRTEPAFLENIAMPSLDDLPELPPDFGGEEQPEMAPAMPTGVMGTLRQMALPEIVQSLEMGRKTARVDLVPADGEKGMIAFEMGQIRYAECGPLRGDEAFFSLARHKEGFFRIHYGDKPPEVNIEHPTTFLLLEAMRRMDEEGQGL